MPIKFEDNSKAMIADLENRVKDALRDAGLLVEGKAKLRAPVDTGNLRGSITSVLIDDNEVQIGTAVEYSIYVEKGTSKQKAQPFLTPAVERNMKSIQRLIEKHIKQAFSRRGGRK